MHYMWPLGCDCLCTYLSISFEERNGTGMVLADPEEILIQPCMDMSAEVLGIGKVYVPHT